MIETFCILPHTRIIKMSYNISVGPACPISHLGPSLTQSCSGSQYLTFMTILDMLVRSQETISQSCERVRSRSPPEYYYDFIVIGGGSAGAVVASRLSDIPEWKVLLLEAGPDEPPGADVPSMVAMFLGSDIDWQYQTTNEMNACLSTGGSCSWPRGKNLGGTSVHNGMMYIRGHAKDFDNWAAMGNLGWSWRDVLPYFMCSENNTEIHRIGRKYHSTGGLLTVERFPWKPAIADDILAAAVEKGYPISEDLNGDQFTGFTVAQTTSKSGVRMSSASAFLRPIRHRRNLHISLNATATKIMIENNKAVGVEFYQDGELRVARATKEVIASGGAVNSPQLLLLSGIGPKEHLQAVNVTVVKDLPGVGENLHNHASYTLSWTINQPNLYDLNWASATEYIAFQKGPMSSTGLSQLTGMLSSAYTTPDHPDIQLFFGGYQAACATTGEVGATMNGNGRSISMSPTMTHPRSKGQLRLASNNPFAKPIIWGNYFNDPMDVTILVEGIEVALSLANTSAMAKYNMTLNNRPLPVCSQYPYLSKEYWACAVRQDTGPENHQAGSCKMGPHNDPMAVVDNRLRVYGIRNLRVADTSIMPQVTSSNTAAPAMMIGEKAAAYIKSDWGVAGTQWYGKEPCPIWKHNHHWRHHYNNYKTRAQRTRFLKTRRSHSRKMNVSEVPEAPCSSPFVSGLSLTDVCSGNSATLFLSMVNVLAAYSPIINGVCGRITPIKRPLPIYDFIVVGGGAGGSVVASRLSEIPNWNVLLVEAGPDEPVGMQIPSNLQLYLNTELDWKYKTTNESYACLKTNGSCSWPRGKNLGGCTGHHGMAYHRGHEKDYARWVEMGNEGWSWKEVLPYFFKSEDNKEIGRVRAQDHGTGGPMTVERFPWQPQFAWDIMSAAKEVGLGTTEDLVGENIKGFTVAQTISNNGVRLSTARAFLWPHRNRKNLHVALNAMATKVNTKKILSKVKADGITFIMNGRRYNVRARKEVILAAGTINSPQLLLLSGIGPKSHLKSVGIRPVVDLPGVGENLHNHQSFGVDFTLSETNTNELNINSADIYFYNQTGPLSSTGLAQLTGILASNYTTNDDPDIQIFFAGYQAICDTGDRIPDLKADGNKETVRFTSVNLQALSRGRITLASNDPLHHPIIWGNDLANPQDRSIMYPYLKTIKGKRDEKMVSGNPVAVVNMIGERVADFIKNDYKVIYTLKAD
ncbi:Uncharacterized protein DBV15_01942 [Temnothorax longispinosus]|uniref:Glucose-methanol-choline oxidoreductase N-terminal domain-containing protein n=1 Tax=Temnothorax longispinosus TaxID=300112 RepID=A0A4S2KXT2_9HYME|nr:Uncharacterized protein DBV15_01942 [Temnothorax longispinosus]